MAGGLTRASTGPPRGDEAMLEIKNLSVEIAGHQVLRNINLTISPGETFVLFGPNGSGKTTLLMAIMGFSEYKVTSGSLHFKGRDITRAPMYERARLGLGLSFQRPPTIHGLSVRNLLRMCAREREASGLEAWARQVNFSRFLDRDVNDGFSGGEIKRSEMLQLMAQRPDFLLFDEPESGVDLENMAVIGRAAKYLLGDWDSPETAGGQPRCLKTASGRAGLIITHTGYILDYVNADRGQVMLEGRLCCEGRPLDILEHIRKHGYRDCPRCLGEGTSFATPAAEYDEARHV